MDRGAPTHARGRHRNLSGAVAAPSLRRLARAQFGDGLGGVDFADFDETKMRLPGTIARFAEAARESSPTEVVTDG